MEKLLLFTLFFFGSNILWSQITSTPTRQLSAHRIESSIKVDGRFDEAAWQNAIPAKDFIQNQPNPGALASQATEVRLLYDDKAIYVGATLYDTQPDSILKQFSERDDIVITDWFGIILDPYQDGLNGTGFIVTAAGVQVDTKYSVIDGGSGTLDGDRNWDAVWTSAVRMVPEGWTVEMQIPYSAIRFPKQDIQTWNINFARMLRRAREESFWNEVKPQLNGLLNQSGKLTGLQDIRPPLRLSATPFVVAYTENYYDAESDPKSTWGHSFSGGMDVKYGINDAFTLDMTLIPDFGQAQSDNQVLNLSPFEIRFNENRQFFTEGTELFNKGGLFYSRRIGGRPLRFFDVADQIDEESEEIVDNPQESQLFNATKISGRTNKGLGIGFFNATSGQTFATVENLESGEKREIETNPTTNYNVFVLDQNLKNNSYVTLINTNVLRAGTAYDANVTGTEFVLKNKANSYAISGGANLSQKYYSGAETSDGQDSVGLGHRYQLGFSKTSGNFQFDANYISESRHYDHNDLGFLFSPNEQTWNFRWNYDIYKPFSIFNRAGTGMNFRYSRLFDPNKFADFGFNLRSFFVTRSFFAFGAWGWFEPFNTFDYFEPRTSDFSRYYAFPRNFNIGGWVSSDYRKRFAYDINANLRTFDESGRRTFEVSFEPRLRVNDKLFFQAELVHVNLRNDVGFISPDEDAANYSAIKDGDITFGRRNQRIFDNTINSSYIFTNTMSLSLRVRHYWTRLEYLSFHELGEEGELNNTNYKGLTDGLQPLHNTSFNIFNIDMIYRWRFAPGSDLFFIWKNAIFDSSDNIEADYFNNLGQLLDAPQLNSFSLKLVYFLDYLQLQRG